MRRSTTWSTCIRSTLTPIRRRCWRKRGGCSNPEVPRFSLTTPLTSRPRHRFHYITHRSAARPRATFQVVRGREGTSAAMRCLLLWLLPHWLFEATRRRIGPHYWSEATFTANPRAAGFPVLETRRTFLDGASVLVWARKPSEG